MLMIRFLTALLVMCVWAASGAAPACAQQLSAPARQVIPSQYVVVLAPQQAAAVVDVANAVAQAHNAQVMQVHRYALQGIAEQVTPAEAAAMAADPRAGSVVPKQEVWLDATRRAGHGVNFINDGQFTNDCTGHRTHVFGTILGKVYGVAKQATVHHVREFGCSGSTCARACPHDEGYGLCPSTSDVLTSAGIRRGGPSYPNRNQG